MERTITEPTRYLCAAVQIDANFCDQILEEFLEEDFTVIGICHGVDLATVLKSCLMAKKRRRKRDTQLALLFLVLFISFWLPSPFSLIVFFVIYIIACRLVFLEQRKSYFEIVGNHFSKENFDPRFVNLQLSSDLQFQLEEISITQKANVIIYGGFSPFVGSGFNINGWSFSIDITKGKEEMGVTKTPLPFTVSELYDYITDSINRLELDGLSIEDNLYINGQGLQNRKNFLPHPLMRPNTTFDDDFIQSFIENPTSSIRHYRCIRVIDWEGELILSIFLRLAKIGQSLFIEANYYLLTPLRQYYRQYDAISSKPSSDDIRKLAFSSLFTTLIFGLASITSIWSKFSKSQQKKKRKIDKEKEIRSNPNYNYGAITTLRERISQNEYQKFFQKLDQEMYLKIIERKVLDELSIFLDSKNIDNSDFKNAKSTILNNGVMVSGGSIQAQSLAVGEGAKSILSDTNLVGERAKSKLSTANALKPTGRKDND